MKKIFTLIAAALMAITASAATTTVGAEDNSDGFWASFSDYYTVKEGQKAHITFKNYSDKAQNWDNWILVTNVAGTERGGEGYKEYFVARVDNYGWGDNWNKESLKSNYNWDTFKSDMDGSSVAMDVYNTDGIIYGSVVITAAAGTVYNYSFNSTNTGAKDFGFFLTVEKAHLTDINVTISEKTATTTVGAEDNSSAFWGATSDFYTVKEGQKANITFKNYSDKAQNWDNWLFVANKADKSEEYFVVRADNYGWGKYLGNMTDPKALLEGASITSDYNWDTFKDDMDGSSVAMDVYNKDGIIYASAVITTAAGTVYNYSFNSTNTGAKDFGFFLTIEKAHLTDVAVTITDQTPTAISTAKAADSQSCGKFIKNGRLVIMNNGLEYNAAGQRVK